jgi:hypothetical protein
MSASICIDCLYRLVSFFEIWNKWREPMRCVIDILPDTALDCFGREKHADYRDDMGGVGSFGRQNRT